MPTLLDFRRRIRSVKNTQQITRAMKFIAAARLRRAQETAVSLRPYASGIREVLRSAMSRIENPEQFPLLTQRPEEKILVLVTAGELLFLAAWCGDNPPCSTRTYRCAQPSISPAMRESRQAPLI